MWKIFFALMIFLLNFSTASAVEIAETNYLGDENLVYPFVIVENHEVEKKINTEIFCEVERFLAEVKNTAKENDAKIGAVAINFEIPCNYEFGILSVILTEYVYFEKAAHPATYRRALNFNSDSGERIFAQSLTFVTDEKKGESDYSPKNLTLKLKAYAKKNRIPLYRDFQQLTKIPEDFYFDENLRVHFIFQQYEVAPYAVGIIELEC